MCDKITNYIICNFFKNNFFSEKDSNYILEEFEESGRSILKLDIITKSNLCINNLDQKNTDIKFFKTEDSFGKKTFLYKRVDHIVFVYDIGTNKWNVHLFEMKSGIENIEKWYEIKGKFRASYIIARAIAAMLHLEINHTTMYTTFEHANLFADKTNPVTRRARIGERVSNPWKEWDGSDFALNFDERKSFIHIPIQMKRNSSGILEATYKI